jgi:hypothetical protein
MTRQPYSLTDDKHPNGLIKIIQLSMIVLGHINAQSV